MLYVFAILFVVAGLSLIVLGAVRENPIVSLVGSIASILFWPAMASARRTRKENIAIRLLEAPLSRADTAKEAADNLRQVFGETFSHDYKDRQKSP